MALIEADGRRLLGTGFRLLGGQMRDRVRTYTYTYDDPAGRGGDNGGGSPLSRDVWLNPAYAASRARPYVDLGFTAVKVDPFSLTLTPDQSLGQNVAAAVAVQPQPARGRRQESRATWTSARRNPLVLTTMSRW